MAKYDEILEEQLCEIRDIAERVIALERDSPSDENRGPEYLGLRFALEQTTLVKRARSTKSVEKHMWNISRAHCCGNPRKRRFA
jgi:hypothetical protein